MIGIYGGTFDPVHYGHLRTALEVKEIFALDEMRLIPCYQPVHRESPDTTAEQRFDMLTLAVNKTQGMSVDRRELDREGYSYMVDTLKSLSAELGQTPLLLFMGTDAFKGLTSWYQWQQLFDYAHVVVITRPGYKHTILSDFLSSRLTENKDNLRRCDSGYLFFQSVTQLDISATVIRKLIKKGLNPRFLLPDNIVDFIHKNKLYL